MSINTRDIYNVNFVENSERTALTLSGDVSHVFRCKAKIDRWDAFLNAAAKILNTLFGWTLASYRTEEVLVNAGEGGRVRIFMRASDIETMDQQATLGRVETVAGRALHSSPPVIRGVNIEKVEDARARQKARMQELNESSLEQLKALLGSAEYEKDMFPVLGDGAGLSKEDIEALRSDTQFWNSCCEGVASHLCRLWGWRIFREGTNEGLRLFAGSEADVTQLEKLVTFLPPMGMQSMLLGLKMCINDSLRTKDRAAWEKTYHFIYLKYLQNLTGRPPSLLAPDPVFVGPKEEDSYYWKTMFPSKISDDLDLDLWRNPNFGKLYLEGVRLHILKQWGWDIDRKNDPQYKPPTREEWTPGDQAQLDEIIRSAEFVGKKQELPRDDWWPLPQPAPKH